MNAQRAWLILLLGIASVLGSCVPLGSSIYQTFLDRPQVDISADNGRAEAVTVDVTPERRARLVVTVDVATESVQEVVESDGATWQARYRFPLSYRITDQSGAVLRREQSHVDWRDDSTSLNQRERQSSLLESDPDVGPQGGTLTARAVFGGFTAPPDGVLVVSAELGEDVTYGADATAAEFALEHDITTQAASRVVLGVFMLAIGWILAIVGFVFVLTGSEIASGGEAVLDVSQHAEVRKLAMFCHLSALLGYVVPFANIVAPLVLWLINRERHAYIDEQGREALNFQLTMLIYALLCFALILVLIGFVMLPLLAIFQLVMVIVASVRTLDGQAWRYPITLRFFR